MPAKRPVRVYPVEGRYLNGVPHVEHDCEDPFCVESGAFTVDPPKVADKPEPEPPADESKED